MSLPRGIFVTGTGTEVGKSVIAALIAATAADEGLDVSVFKPAVSGLDELEPGEEADHELLARASGSAQSADEIAPYRFGPPVSPHLAAELAGSEPIDPERLRTAARRAAARAADADGALVCEGVGGLLVPLSDDYLVIDMARDIGLPLAIVAPPGLGTINHTLLTLSAARAANLEVRAVVLDPWPENPTEMERSNQETIARLGAVEVTTVPWVNLTANPSSWPTLALL